MYAGLFFSLARDPPCISFCGVRFADSNFPMSVLQGSHIASTGVGALTIVQPKAVTRVTPFLRQKVGPNVANVPVAHKQTPLERELEAVDGICLQQLGQPVAEFVGRVSVVTPITGFHPQLWQCFVDRSWPDKELVVVETYHDEPSAFFQSIARMDERLTYYFIRQSLVHSRNALEYVAIKRPVGEDLTVGAKRNLTILQASGQYTSSTLTTMISMPTGMWNVWCMR